MIPSKRALAVHSGPDLRNSHLVSGIQFAPGALLHSLAVVSRRALPRPLVTWIETAEPSFLSGSVLRGLPEVARTDCRQC